MAGRRNRVFPQANSIPLVIETLNLISENKKIHPSEISSRLNVVNRQVDYYLNVLHYFGLITDKNELTLKGRFINDPVLDNRDKSIILKNVIIEDPVFKKVDQYIRETKSSPKINTIAEFIGEHYMYSDSTLIRRASTVRSWFKFFISQNIYEVKA